MQKNNPAQMRNERNGLSAMKDKAFDKFEEAGEEIEAAYPEIEDIRKDWKALKDDVSALTSHATSDGSKKLREATSGAVEKIEKHVHDKPAQTLAIAFAIGVVASFLFGGRR